MENMCMKKIYLLTDYKGNFESKCREIPYRSGMDKELLKMYFSEAGFQIEFLKFSDVDFKKKWQDTLILYTSMEDFGYFYKGYIEDIVYGLEQAGAITIPNYKLLKANNNKVFMEILREQLEYEEVKSIKSFHFGSLEELESIVNEIDFPVVIKPAAGALSRGVSLAHNKRDLIKQAKKISRTRQIKNELWDLGRSYKHKGYVRESNYRKKFIIQNYIEGLDNDFKILVYGNKYFFFYRNTRKNDFRASGSGDFHFRKEYPYGMLEYAHRIHSLLNVPNISIDVCFDGKHFHLLEFQAVYFGTIGLVESPFHYARTKEGFQYIEEKSILEKVYAESIIQFIKKNFTGKF